MREEDMPYRPDPISDVFTISREALDEAYSALAGAEACLGNVANINHAMNLLRTAEGNQGEKYPGHQPNFVVADSSEQPPSSSEANLGLATNREIEAEIEARRSLGHTHPDYRSSNYDGPVA